jgi:hypothetical protein
MIFLDDNETHFLVHGWRVCIDRHDGHFRRKRHEIHIINVINDKLGYDMNAISSESC